MNEPFINDELAAFISSGLLITLASRNADNIPSAARQRLCADNPEAPANCRYLNQHHRQDRQWPIYAPTAPSRPPSACLRLIAHAIQGMRCTGCRVAANGFSPAFVRAFFASPLDELVVEFTPTDGIPNVSYVSQVHYVDTTHVALTYQFLNKAR